VTCIPNVGTITVLVLAYRISPKKSIISLYTIGLLGLWQEFFDPVHDGASILWRD